MKFQHLAALVFSLIVLALFIGCNDDGGGSGSANTAPVISGLTANPASGSVDLYETSTLTVSASDADGDAITFTWNATAGTLDTLHGTTVEWTAPDEALPSIITVWASDGAAEVSSIYTFDFSNFTPGAPVLDSIHATPAHLYIITVANKTQWFMELYAGVTAVNGSEIIRVTAEMPSGSILNLRDDGVWPDVIPNDNTFEGFPGSYTMVVDTGWVSFNAVNQYYQEASDSFFIDVLCDSFPVVIPDSVFDNETQIWVPSVDGDVYEYLTGTPNFRWFSYTSADYYQIWLTRMDYTMVWQPSGTLTDTTAMYNYDNSATLIQLELNNDYIFHLRVDKGNSWAKRELQIRRTN